MSADRVRDLDAWRRVCLEAYHNLPADTVVTMGQVDIVLLAGARESVAADTSTAEGSAEYGQLLDRLSRTTGVERGDVDAILAWCAADAVTHMATGAPDVTEEDVVVRANHEPIASFVFDAIDQRRPINPDGQWDALDDLAKVLDRLVTRGMHPDDRARAAEAMVKLADLWLVPEQTVDDLLLPDGGTVTPGERAAAAYRAERGGL